MTKRYLDEEGVTTLKSNTDLDMAVDALTEASKLDTVLLVTGDGDFVQVVRALQNKGCRVELLAFDNVSKELRDSVDQYINGYLVPNLLLTPHSAAYTTKLPYWGQVGSRVRGVCTGFDYERGHGFLKYFKAISSTQIVKSSPENSSAFFKSSDLRNTNLLRYLLDRERVFEFELAPSDRTQETRFTAKDIIEI